MKKLILTTLTLLTCGMVHALPVGNPAEASLLTEGLFFEGNCCRDLCDPCVSWCDAISLRLGFYGDYIFEKHMEVDQSNRDDDIEHTEIYTNAAIVALNFYDCIDLFATFGATNLFLETNSSAFGLVPTRFEIETETDFSWSIGARGTIWECGCTVLGIEGQYFYTNPHVTRVGSEQTNVYLANNIHAKYYAWQIGVGLAHRVHILVPYAAVTVGHSKLDFGDARITVGGPPDADLRDLESKKDWGYAIGVTMLTCDRISMTLEGRFANENAVHVNGQFRF